MFKVTNHFFPFGKRTHTHTHTLIHAYTPIQNTINRIILKKKTKKNHEDIESVVKDFFLQ